MKKEIYIRTTPRTNIFLYKYNEYYILHIATDASEEIHAILRRIDEEQVKRLVELLDQLVDAETMEEYERVQMLLLDEFIAEAPVGVIGKDLYMGGVVSIHDEPRDYEGFVELMDDGHRIYFAKIPDVFEIPLEAFDDTMFSVISIILLAWRNGDRKRRLRPRRCGNSLVFTAPPEIDDERLYVRYNIRDVVVYVPYD